MITATPSAVRMLRKITEANEAAYVRLAVIGGGCSGFQYSMTTESSLLATDTVYEFEDGSGLVAFRVCVLVDMISKAYIANLNLDYNESILQSGFKFNNPDVKTTCGCGSSFGA